MTRKLKSMHIRVGPYLFKVDTSDTARAVTAGAGLRGTCLSDELVIYIDPDLPYARQLATLLHEVMHEALNDGPEIKGITDDQIEAVLNLVERTLVQLVKDEYWIFYDLNRALTRSLDEEQHEE